MDNERFDELFDSPSFQDLLHRYTEAEAQGKNIYLDLDDVFDLMDFFVDNNEDERTERLLEYAITLHPNDLQLKCCRIRNYMLNGNLATAMPLLEEIKHEESDDVTFLIGVAQVLQGKSKEAMQFLWEYFTDNKRVKNVNFFIWIDLINLFIDEKDQNDYAMRWGELVLTLSKEQQVEPDLLGRLYKVMSEIYIGKGLFNKATELLEKVLEDDPYDYASWLRLGVAYIEKELYDDALEALSNAAAIRPESLEPILFKAECYRVIPGELDNAYEAYKQCYDAGFMLPNTSHGLGVICYKKGMFADAINYLEEAADLSSDKSLAERMKIYRALIKSYARNGDYEKAAQLFNSVGAGGPDNIVFTAEDFKELMKQKRFDSPLEDDI